MVRHALISLSPPAFIRFVDAPARTKAGYAIVPAVDAEPPAYDPATHRVKTVVKVSETEVTRGWQIVALPQSAIDAAGCEAKHTASTEDKEAWIAALESGKITAAQTRKIIAWLLREITGLR